MYPGLSRRRIKHGTLQTSTAPGSTCNRYGTGRKIECSGVNAHRGVNSGIYHCRTDYFYQSCIPVSAVIVVGIGIYGSISIYPTSGLGVELIPGDTCSAPRAVDGRCVRKLYGTRCITVNRIAGCDHRQRKDRNDDLICLGAPELVSESVCQGIISRTRLVRIEYVTRITAVTRPIPARRRGCERERACVHTGFQWQPGIHCGQIPDKNSSGIRNLAVTRTH